MGAQPKTQNTVLAVVRALEEDIVLGRLFPRERLVEDALAARFDIKRHVVRQVLGELEAAGLIVRLPGRGALVREYGAGEVEQLYQMREIVEARAAMMIPLPAAPEDRRRLDEICRAYAGAVESGDMQGVIAANKAFHQVLYRLCGNRFLADVIDDLAQKANLIRFSSSTEPAYLARARDEHYRILEALEGDDNEHLARLCVAHLQPSRRMYLEKKALTG